MIWNPRSMLMIDVYGQFGSLKKAGLKRIGRQKNNLILTFLDGTKKVVKPGEEIPLPGPVKQ